jgi:DDE superfamily endonuclease
VGGLRESPLYGIISAIDGIAVEIRCPTAADCSNPTSYYNRKVFYTIRVQAAILTNYKVCFLSTKHAGSTHDSTAFGATSLQRYLLKTEPEGGLPDWDTVSADNAYGNGSAGGRILTPYSGSLMSVKESFSYFLSSLRIMEEQTFGVVVARWGILWSPLRCSWRRRLRLL